MEPRDVIEDLDFWSHFIHHLRNTVGTISSVADFCRSYPVDPEKLLSIFTHIANSAQNSMIHVDEFAQLLRPLKVRPRPLALEPWLRLILPLHPVSRAVGVTVNWEVSRGGCEVKADPVRLERVVWAVLDNSLDAMAQGGVMTVRIGAEGGKLRLGFGNTGPAIPAAIRHHIWEPFFTTKADRMGIGLSWVRKIAMAHGCLFGVRSHPRGGVETWLQWPAANRS